MYYWYKVNHHRSLQIIEITEETKTNLKKMKADLKKWRHNGAGAPKQAIKTMKSYESKQVNWSVLKPIMEICNDQYDFKVKCLEGLNKGFRTKIM